jgi:hypothetical protein
VLLLTSHGYVDWGILLRPCRQDAAGVTCWWEIGIGEAGTKLDLWPAESIDVTRLSAHQKLELQTDFARVQEILREL